VSTQLTALVDDLVRQAGDNNEFNNRSNLARSRATLEKYVKDLEKRADDVDKRVAALRRSAAYWENEYVMLLAERANEKVQLLREIDKIKEQMNSAKTQLTDMRNEPQELRGQMTHIVDFSDLLIFSVDIETNGHQPGKNSMLSVGISVLNIITGEEASSFYQKLKPLPDAEADADTMEWWKTQPEAWDEVNKNQGEPEEVMLLCRAFVQSLVPRPVALCAPAAYDWPFLQYYFTRFTGGNPFGSRCMDLKSYAAGVLNKPYGMGIPDEWKEKAGPHTHKALDDAREQAQIFFAALQENRARRT
jgi:hypothetical protein